MSDSPDFVHPYIPNSAPQSRSEMLRAIGVGSVEELYDGIPDHLRLNRPLAVPGPILS